MFSANEDEEEVILLPGTRLRAKANTTDLLEKLFVTHFKEVQLPKYVPRKRDDSLLRTFSLHIYNSTVRGLFRD